MTRRWMRRRLFPRSLDNIEVPRRSGGGSSAASTSSRPTSSPTGNQPEKRQIRSEFCDDQLSSHSLFSSLLSSASFLFPSFLLSSHSLFSSTSLPLSTLFTSLSLSFTSSASQLLIFYFSALLLLLCCFSFLLLLSSYQIIRSSCSRYSLRLLSCTNRFGFDERLPLRPLAKLRLKRRTSLLKMRR